MNYYDAFLILSFGWKNMPINVIGISSSNSEKNSYTSVCTKKHYLGASYKETKVDEDIVNKNNFGIKILPEPINIRETCSKN